MLRFLINCEGTLGDRYRNSLIYLSLIVIAVLIYFKTLSFGLILLDDGDIQKNFDFFSNMSNVWGVFNHSYWGLQGVTVSSYHRPIVTALTIIQCSISKAWFQEFNPAVFHITNVVLHTTAVLLLYSALVRFHFGRKLSWWLAVLFSIHPLHVSTVAWIGGINDLLLMNFSLLTLWSFQKIHEKRNWAVLLWAHGFFFLCALLTKENAVVLFVLLPLLTVTTSFTAEKPVFLDEIGTVILVFFKTNASIIVTWLIVFSVFVLIRLSTGSTVDSPTLPNAMKSILYSWPGLLTYLGKFFIPRGLAGLPVLPNTPVVPAILSIIALAVWIKRMKRTNGISFAPLVFGFSWFMLFLLPTFVRFDPQFWSSEFILREDRSYTANLGLLLGLGNLIQGSSFTFGHSLNYKSRLIQNHWLIIMIVAIIFSMMTMKRIGHYKDDLEFYSAVVKESPSLSFGYVNLGTSYVFRNDFESANRFFEKALKMNPTERKLNNNIGVIQMRSGNFQEAKNSFMRELEHYPDYYESWLGLGQASVQLDEEKLAIDAFKKASILRPGNPEPEVHLLEYYKKKGRIKDFDELKTNLEKRGIQIWIQ